MTLSCNPIRLLEGLFPPKEERTKLRSSMVFRVESMLWLLERGNFLTLLYAPYFVLPTAGLPKPVLSGKCFRAIYVHGYHASSVVMTWRCSYTWAGELSAGDSPELAGGIFNDLFVYSWTSQHYLRTMHQSITTSKKSLNSIKILSHRRVAPVRSSGPTGQAESAEKNISFIQSGDADWIKPISRLRRPFSTRETSDCQILQFAKRFIPSFRLGT